MGDLTLDSNALVDASELFGNDTEQGETTPEKTNEGEKTSEEVDEKTGTQEPEKNPEEKESTTEVKATAEDLFGNEEKPEEVGGEHKEGTQEPESKEDTGVSPLTSFAKALHEDGHLSALDDETVSKITTAQQLSDAIDKEVESRLDDKQKKIAQALESGIPTGDIQKYNNILVNLDKITEEGLSTESDEAKGLRENIIYQDFLNRGISPERAKSLTDRSVADGQDIEDAKVALAENKKFFQTQFDTLTANAKKEADAQKQKTIEEANNLKKEMLENDELFKGIKVSKTDRQKAYDALTKPVASNSKGMQLTAIQKFAEDNPVEFRKILGMTYAVTDGFKGLDKLIKKEVKGGVQNHMKEFENQLKSSTGAGSNGNIHYAEKGKSNETQPKSMFDEGWLPDVS